MLEGANMDENEKPDGSTAMERLCRELAGCVLFCPMCGVRYGWPACEAGAGGGGAE